MNPRWAAEGPPPARVLGTDAALMPLTGPVFRATVGAFAPGLSE